MSASEKRQIVGIMLVKNEDRYIERILDNIHSFCDTIIVADNQSTDQTAQCVDRFRQKSDKVAYHFIAHPMESHDLIRHYGDSRSWIFGVDGDEVYDPDGLTQFRQQVLRGDFDNWWMILGNVLNCIELDPEHRYARGYLSPPCRSMTKMYNFNAIHRWEGICYERLHGGSISFKPGMNALDRYDLNKTVHWDRSLFRCLHLCFLPRSTHDKNGRGGLIMRQNIADRLNESFFEKLVSGLLRHLGKPPLSKVKREKYMRGNLVEKDVRAFFPPG